MSKKPSKPREKKAPPAPAGAVGLIGLASDNDDGHRRVTTGEQFVLVGGSEETHARMTETTIKTFEELKKRNQRLETVDLRELCEIVEKSKPR